jgi:hypothetical protein
MAEGRRDLSSVGSRWAEPVPAVGTSRADADARVVLDRYGRDAGGGLQVQRGDLIKR